MLEFVESDDEKSDGDVEEEEERMEHVTNDFLTAFAGCDVGDIGPEMSHSGFHFHNRHLKRRPVIETNTRLKEIRCISASEVIAETNLSRAQRLGAYRPRGYSHIVLYWIRTYRYSSADHFHQCHSNTNART